MSNVQSILDRAFAPLAEAIETRRIPGGVLGIVDRDGNRAVRAIGSAQIDAGESADDRGHLV